MMTYEISAKCFDALMEVLDEAIDASSDDELLAEEGENSESDYDLFLRVAAGVASKSHGDGRRMTVAEAIERRARMIRVHGSIRTKFGRRLFSNFITPDRRWNATRCCAAVGESQSRCIAEAMAAEDVGLLDGVPVAMCPTCRSAQQVCE